MPARKVSPDFAPLCDPVENQASVAATASLDAEGAAASDEVSAAGADNLRLSTDRGGELADQADTEAEG
ncbi:MAG: hypothetical protein MUO38_15295 [Anaerolineales bacterium]|nr:hypothetical protein [Anaerolineales bacterium]